MKCTDNRHRKRRRLSKRQRRRRAIIRLMRRILVLLVLIVTVIFILKIKSNNSHAAAEYEFRHYNVSYSKEDLYSASLCVANSNIELDSISDVYAFGLFDVNNCYTRYAYQIHDKIYPASTTKILTALVALENAALDEIVTVSANACSTSFAWDEQTCGIKEGDQISLEDLLYGLLLYSGNDTAVAIAEHIGGSVESFAEMMNERAHELMATNSHFTNPSGLYDDEHYTTAYDLYLIFNECIKNDTFVEIISTNSYTAEITRGSSEKVTIKFEPTNFYALGTAKAPDDVTIIGGKTGTLDAAGNCLILMSEDKDSNPFISVVMGADNKDVLYKDMTSLLAEISKNE